MVFGQEMDRVYSTAHMEPSSTETSKLTKLLVIKYLKTHKHKNYNNIINTTVD